MIISPHEEAHFSREGVVDINAAVVGISQTRWKYIEESDATDEQAKAIMHQQYFDILPVVNNTVVKKYFHTKKWSDYSEIYLKTITHKDVIPFHTNIRDVIKGFVLESRNFYFLQNERCIVGLISVVNLNCRQVKVYLFSLLSELEVCLGKFITTHISEDELLRMTFWKEEKEKHKDVKKRYQEAKNTGIDVPFVEYLYLTDLIDIISKNKLYEQLGYSSGTYFTRCLGSLNDLRNAVAHPARAIITEKHPVEKLWERIDRIEEALFLLR